MIEPLFPKLVAHRRVWAPALALLGLGLGSACSGGDDDSGAAAAGTGGGSQAGAPSSGGSGDQPTAGTGSGGKSGASASSGGSGGHVSTGKGGSAGRSSGGSGAVGGSGESGAGSPNAGGDAGSGGSAAGAPSGSGTSTAADVARKLGRATNFLIGMGNDLNNDHNQDGAYTLGTTLDMHYAYLVGLPGKGGWPDWNADGGFVDILADSADAHGVTPMYTLYAMAANGEGNAASLSDSDYMGRYWDGAKLMFQRLGAFDKPSIVHLEPDFWAYFQQQSNGDPSAIKVLIHGLAADCEDQPENLAGLGHCLIKLSRMYSPKTVIGFHASRWAGDPAATATFLTALGADESDVVVIDMLDRDAGCFEAHTDPGCQRTDGPWYWDESNQSTPNFHEFLAFSKQISDGIGKPILWWQVPFGVPSDTAGGTAGHYRDNRVHYIFNHIDEFIAAGGLGVAFGTGAGNQTDITTDGGQFHDAVNAYFANPVALP
jgi:hypothetical protein